MATFLFTWELGGGLGHVMPFRPVAERLIAKGHRVVAALRELTHAERAFGDLSMEYLPAPFKSWRTADRMDPLLTFAHILHNTGWSSVNDLRTLTNAWRTIFRSIKPDVVICDHSPTALLALRGVPRAIVMCATGYASAGRSERCNIVGCLGLWSRGQGLARQDGRNRSDCGIFIARPIF